MARRGNRNPIVRIVTQLTQNQGWDKSSIATLIGSIGTICALLFSVYQNNISDRRYFENDIFNKIEQQRVSKRDSAQITTSVHSGLAPYKLDSYS